MALYTFKDTIAAPAGSSDLPAEALAINGTYIENIVDGYRTLNVSGRETMAQEVKEAEVGKHDGAFFQYRRYPTRDIVVTYQILADSDTAYREAFIKLNSMLNFEEGQLIFNDEPDKYFIGTPTEVETPEPGLNTVTGEFTLHCEDPFKYSVDETVVDMSEDENGAFFTVDYAGTHKSYPRLETDFYQTDTEDDDHGECSFVAFMNEDEKILQFGNPEDNNYNTAPVRIFKRGLSAPVAPTAQLEYSFETEAIVDTADLNGWSETIPTGSAKLWTTKAIASSTSTLAYIEASEWGTVEEYDNQDDSGDYKRIKSKTEINKKWTAVDSVWSANSGNVYNSHNQTGSINIVTDGKTNKKCTHVAGYGSGSKWHGPSVTRSKADNIVDWKLTFNYRFAQTSGSNAVNQSGQFQAVLWSHSGKDRIIAAIQMWKVPGSSKGSIRLIVDGKSVKVLNDINFSNSALYTKDNTLRACSITKTGSTIVFKIRSYEYRFVSQALEEIAVNRCTFYFAKKGDSTAMYNGIANTKLLKRYQAVPPNPYTTNDELRIDTKEAQVLLNDLDAQNLGALANDWENFCLKPGLQQIGIVWSEWVPVAYKPTFRLAYREVYL